MASKPCSHKIARLQRFEPLTINRSEIKNSAYNPRKIKGANRAKLNKSLDEFGLVEPLIWNRRSGNLVGGHRRLEKIDAQEGGAEFSLTVSAIDLDPAREKALNIILNNHAAQGEYDDALLTSLLRDLEKEGALDLTGFGQSDLKKLLKESKPQPVSIGASFEVIVECANEAEQKKHFERFAKEGLKCRVLTL